MADFGACLDQNLHILIVEVDVVVEEDILVAGILAVGILAVGNQREDHNRPGKVQLKFVMLR